MDADASRLIAGLEEKLADLDRKVATYRQDLADEFAHHEARVLRHLPESLSATIQRSVALAAHKYPAISPALARPAPTTTGAESPSGSPSPDTPPRAAAAASIAAAAASTSTPGTGATATSTTTAATTASRPAGHEASSPASRLPRPATPPPPLRPPRRPSSPAATDDLGQMSDSPDDREADLRGIITPSFLPLLDTSINLRAPPTPPKPRAPRNNSHMTTTTTSTSPMDAGGPGRPPAGEPPLSSTPPTPAQLPVRPATVRRATDDLSTSSVLSDKSDSKSRRSALRRSSSSSKPQSPRRVRFEVAGAEVLPTSSPSDSSPDVRQPPSDGGYTAPGHEDDDDPARPRSVEAILGLADAEDDEPPPPKKVSSTQALRALSRMPLDSDTVWVPVTQDANPGSDSGGRADAVEPKATFRSGARTAPSRRPGTPPPKRPANLDAGRAKTHLGAPLQPAAESWQDDEDSDDSDEDFLSIGRPKSFAKKKPTAPPRSNSPSSDEASRPVSARRATTDAVSESVEGLQPSALPRGPSEGLAMLPRATQPISAPRPVKSTREEPPDVGPDYSDVFDFEASEGMPARPPTPPADLSDSETEDTRPVSREPLHMYSTSPAVNIPQVSPGQKPARADDAASTPTNIPGSVSKATPAVGSYKGRSITMPVVVDPSVHEQAAALGDFSTFVGGLDGRSGMDDGDVNSFRASLATVAVSGTPRSLTERMMMEERLGKGVGWEGE